MIGVVLVVFVTMIARTFHILANHGMPLFFAVVERLHSGSQTHPRMHWAHFLLTRPFGLNVSQVASVRGKKT